MKLQFKRQKFQEDAAKAVVEVFAGQPYADPVRQRLGNQPVAPWLSDGRILEQIQKIQRENGIKPSEKLEGHYNLTVEMETGVGKTYTYLKTIYELNQHYGWSKFIIVVPSIAVREGVYKSFQVTQEHFAREYEKKVRFFLYDSGRLAEIEKFASDPSLQVMILNAQAFNAKGKNARRITMESDEFHSRRPIDVIAQTNPILILDEPQSVEGKQTRKNMREFHPLFTLRYSATHRKDSIYNMVYRLDAAEAYERQLVKKIQVKGISETGTGASEGYLYLEGIRLSRSDPRAVLQFDRRGPQGIQKITRTVGIGYDLYEHSGRLEEYRDRFIVKAVDGRDDSIEFLNGIRLYAGEAAGKTSEEQLRRIQIRETILSHLEKERQLFARGIKVLSLFFIDEVEHYRKYDALGQPVNGRYAQIFEQEYAEILRHLELDPGEEDYGEYLRSISVHNTHAGYFSIDKKGRMVNSKGAGKEKISEDADAYDLIMKKKELLLEQDPVRSPVRFLFSHSALREGWDNPNVFQICTLKQSTSQIRKRQEIGRGMRLCVNEKGERMDAGRLGREVQKVNLLTVIASESYDQFARALQKEMKEDSDGGQEEQIIRLENARRSSIQLSCDPEKLRTPEFQTLWAGIRGKSVYRTDIDSEELVRRSVQALDAKLHIPRLSFVVEQGVLEPGQPQRKNRTQTLEKSQEAEHSKGAKAASGEGIRYDLVGKLAEETRLTRKVIIDILTGIRREVFEQFADHPEEFIQKAAGLIREQEAAAIIEHIVYQPRGEQYDTSLFTGAVLRGKPGVNAIEAQKHLFDYVLYESAKELAFARELEAHDQVALYVKLPESFFISTPVGRCTPGWAVVFRTQDRGYLCAAAELKGSRSVRGQGSLWEARAYCAKKHFQAVSGGTVLYETVDSFGELLERVTGRTDFTKT